MLEPAPLGLRKQVELRESLAQFPGLSSDSLRVLRCSLWARFVRVHVGPSWPKVRQISYNVARSARGLGASSSTTKTPQAGS
jgi:hypothetical protein